MQPQGCLKDERSHCPNPSAPSEAASTQRHPASTSEQRYKPEHSESADYGLLPGPGVRRTLPLRAKRAKHRGGAPERFPPVNPPAVQTVDRVTSAEGGCAVLFSPRFHAGITLPSA